MRASITLFGAFLVTLLISAALSACSTGPASPQVQTIETATFATVDAALHSLASSPAIGVNDRENVATAATALETAWAAYVAGGYSDSAAISGAISASVQLLIKYGITAPTPKTGA